MMKTYFIFSDIHSFYDEFIKALNDAGFDINNEEHVLVSLGDIFDRGKKPLEIYEFLRSIPKERRILVRGNHELLLREMMMRGFAESHDKHNGTEDTIFYLETGKDRASAVHDYYKETSQYKYGTYEYKQVVNKHGKRNLEIWRSNNTKAIIDWMFSDEWVNFYETSNYIFVHSWIPTHQDYEIDEWGYTQMTGPETFREDWRNATDYEWEDAMWRCPWQQVQKGLNKTGKTIVCGHWHTSDFFNHLTKQKKDTYDCPIFKSKRYKLIGLDACTVISHKVNVLVIEEKDL